MNGLDLTKDITVPELISKLFKIVNDIAEKVGYVNSKSYVEQNSSYYGYYFKENKNIWFGVDFEVWKEKKSPIIVWIDYDIKELDSNIRQELEKEEFEPYEVEEDNEKYYVYIYPYKLEEIESMEKMISKINKTKEILKNVK